MNIAKFLRATFFEEYLQTTASEMCESKGFLWRVFSGLRNFCSFKREYMLEKARILACFMQCSFSKDYCRESFLEFFVFLHYFTSLQKENQKRQITWILQCVKSVRIWSFSGPYFPSFGLNTEKYFASLCIQSEYEKIRTRKTPNTDTFHAVISSWKPPIK